ncbi:hypothetical protein DFP72DRAFT_1064733 [Ephemerocybe angulata]|uniref:Ricin B lectin domain-containing protein n=1 Tax=Ephemerocybe angulata TaxID=980116 RepID=A0A8H6I4B3_9AGAR|nr:hypothetical protein DFP72DRAFT_1064733 [Tulosesus angulatus]
MPAEPGPNEEPWIESETSYAFTNVHTGHPITIDPDTNTVVGSIRFTGTPFQVWEAASVNGLWTFKNAETGRYLGYTLYVPVKEGDVIKATTHPFTWQVTRDAKGWAKLSVPYTNFVLDMEANQNSWAVTGRTSYEQSNQRWILDSEITFKLPITAGNLYKIVSSNVGAVVNLDDSSEFVSGYKYNEGRNQKWEAIPGDAGTWFLKNHLTHTYLGIGAMVANHGTPVVGTEQPFAWDIIRKYVDGKPCKRNGVMLRVPSTELALNPDYLSHNNPGTKIQLQVNPTGYWILKKGTPA